MLQTRLKKLIKSGVFCFLFFYNTPCLFICVPLEQLKLHTHIHTKDSSELLIQPFPRRLMSSTRSDESVPVCTSTRIEVNRSSKWAVKHLLPHKVYSITCFNENTDTILTYLYHFPTEVHLML